MNKYEWIIYWSEEDRAFVVKVPGCKAGSATCQEAVAGAKQIIQECIDTAKALNRPISEPKGRLMYA